MGQRAHVTIYYPDIGADGAEMRGEIKIYVPDDPPARGSGASQARRKVHLGVGNRTTAQRMLRSIFGYKKWRDVPIEIIIESDPVKAAAELEAVSKKYGFKGGNYA